MAETVGCWWEAKRADDVAAALTQIRTDLDASFHADITNVVNSILRCASLLRDISDLLRIYRTRGPLVREFMVIFLPSLQTTLDKFVNCLGERTLSFKSRWNKITSELCAEASISVFTRFLLFQSFMVQLVRLLCRPSTYEPHVLKSTLERTVKLRAAQGLSVPRTLPLPPKSQDVKIYQADVSSQGSDSAPVYSQSQSVHWAQQIFDRKQPATKMKHQTVSCCYAPSMPDAALEIPPDSTVLFKLKFNQNMLSVVAYIHPDTADNARILCRWADHEGSPAYASKGLHELRIKRKRDRLELEGYCREEERPKPWLALYFKTWEKMVLFHDVFVALKKRSPLAIECDPKEIKLKYERRLVQKKIVDDKYDHVVTLYRDKATGGIRLCTTIFDGPLSRFPIWTAFVSPADVKSNFIKQAPKRVLLRKLDLNIFSSDYQPSSQMTKSGSFVLAFHHDRDAVDFVDAWKALAKEIG